MVSNAGSPFQPGAHSRLTTPIADSSNSITCSSIAAASFLQSDNDATTEGSRAEGEPSFRNEAASSKRHHHELQLPAAWPRRGPSSTGRGSGASDSPPRSPLGGGAGDDSSLHLSPVRSLQISEQWNDEEE
eukprot:Selendium_serpulae@DN3994_c1_g1_i2.p1